MIKILAKSIREYKFPSILSPIAVLFETILEVIIPLLMAKLIDDGIYRGEMGVIGYLAIESIGCALLSLLFGMLAGIFASRASSGFAKNLRKDMYYHIQKFSFSNIDKFSTSSLVTRLTTDVSEVQMAYMMIIRAAIRAPFMLIVSLIFALNISPKLSQIFLVLIPILSIGIFLVMRVARKYFKKVFATYDELNNVVEENVRGIRVVKSFILEEEEKQKFSKISQKIFELFTKAQKIMAVGMPFMQLTIYACIIFICWFGAQIIVNSNMTELTTGQLMTMLTYTIQILSSLMMLSMVIVMVVIARPAGERITEVLKEKPDIENPENPVKEMKDGSIEFKNVSFSYVKGAKKEILKNINLKIKSGETIGIIGGIGSGKSTIVNLIPRLYDVTKGELLVGGINVKDYDLDVLRNNVSCVLQKNILFSGTIKENIKWGNLKATDKEVIKVCKIAQADSFIREMKDGYNAHIEQGGTNVSGGQKQRLCIARALLKKPQILILDDSTSAVDTRTDKKLQEAFKKEIPNTTKIIIAQRISSVENCDKIIVMNNCKIEAFGTHKELLKKNKIYKEVYDLQKKGGDK